MLKLLINEWRFCIRQPLVLASLVFVPVFAVLLSVGLDAGDYNATKQLQLTLLSLPMLSLPIVLAGISPAILLRDSIADMAELIDSSPVAKKRRWLLRYVAIVSIALLSYLLSYLVVLVLLSVQLGFVWEFLAITVWSLFMLVVPAILFFAALALCFAVLEKSAMAIYAGFGVIWCAYLFFASVTGSPILAGSTVVSLPLYNTMLWCDPYGNTALIDKINAANSFLDLTLTINRLAFVGLSLLLVNFVLNMKRRTRRTRKEHHLSESLSVHKDFAFEPAKVTSAPISKFTRLVRATYSSLLNDRVTQILLVAWPVLIGSEVLASITFVAPMSVQSPNSIDALNRIAFDVLPVLGVLVLAFWSWQICHRDERCYISEVVAASPISNGLLVSAHIFVIWLMVVHLLLLTFIGASVAEWAAGSDWRPQHYLLQLALNALPLTLLGGMFIAVHHLCRRSLVSASIIAFILLVKFTPVTGALGLTHTLWNIGDTPLQEPDSFWGYSASASVYLPYISVWLLVCFCMVWLASYASHRGTGFDLVTNKNLARRALIPLTVSAFACLVLHIALIDEKPLLSSAKREAWRAQYEVAYGHWRSTPQPSITHIDSVVDIYPQLQKAEFKLAYTLENLSDADVSQVLVGRYGAYGFGEVSIPGAKLVDFDPDLNQAVYEFTPPLKTGERRTLMAEFVFNQPTLWPARLHQIVKPEFTYLRSTPMLPTIGYQTEYQLRDSRLRTKHGLELLEDKPPSELFSTDLGNSGAYQWASMNSIISTHAEHHAVSQGEMIKSWQQNQRAYFMYRTVGPIRSIPAWLSVPYLPESSVVGDVQLNVYAQRSSAVVQLNRQAMTDTLLWFDKHVAPLRVSQLHLFAMPDLGPTGYALPQILLISDTAGFRTTPSQSAGFDQRYRRAVHETAHQWFGHDLGNGVLTDRAFLIESMAKYVELVLIEKHYGEDAMQALVEYEKTLFELGRRSSLYESAALIDATETHDIYSRATLVFAELREAIGDEAITTALKSLWQSHAYPNTPATSMDFVRVLKESTQGRHHAIIDDLLLDRRN